MKESVSFSGKPIEKSSADFMGLRQKGLDYLQALSGEVWTDYNSHDPGVTILEQLCYALTDLGYRSDFPIQDLLAHEEDGRIRARKNAFFSKDEIFSTHPVTLIDTKKGLIDTFDEIQNVWIKPKDNSGFEEQLIVTEKVEILPKYIFNNSLKVLAENEDELIQRITDYLAKNRNLGEDVETVRFLKPKPISIDFKIHLSEQKNIEKTIAHIIQVLFEYLYTPVRHYTLKEMIEDGYPLNEIFTGPKLNNGFIKPECLRPRVMQIDTEGLQQLISKGQDTYKCTVLKINDGTKSYTTLSAEEGTFFHLLDDNKRRSSANSPFDRVYEHLTVYINGKEYPHLNIQKIQRYFYESWAKKYRQYPIADTQKETNGAQLSASFRNPKAYFSIQNHFPIIYGIGHEGISKMAPPERHAQAKQLKAYLLFFEQHLADYLAQLSHIDDFFDIDFKHSLKKTYFSQAINTAVNIDEVHPSTGFATPACVYFKTSQRVYIPAEIDDQAFDDLKANDQKLFLKRVASEPVLFSRYLKIIKPRGLREPLLFGSALIKEYMVLLFKIPFKWLDEQTSKDFWSSAVLSFVLLTKVEEKKYQPVVFFEAFRNHLNAMLIAIDKTAILDELPDRLGDIKIPEDVSESRFKICIETLRSLTRSESSLDFFKRKNRIYNHLLARFGESLDPTPWEVALQLKQIKNEVAFRQILLQKKSDFLLSIDKLSRETSKGESYVYSRNSDPTKREPSGLENLICSKTGIRKRIHRRPEETLRSETNDEVFYLVDHVLLRDFLNVESSFYGFTFYDALDRPICGTTDDKSWCNSPLEREILMQDFFTSGNDAGNFTSLNGRWVLKSSKTPQKTIATFLSESASKEEIINETKLLINLYDSSVSTNGRTRLNEIEKIRAKGTKDYARGRYGQRHLIFQRKLSTSPNGLKTNEASKSVVINEDFFNLSISIVLPNWPIRFKEKRFASYVGNLIQERMPSHLRLNLLWVDKEEMRAFTKAYFKWEDLKVSSEENSEQLKWASFGVYQQLIHLNQIRTQ